jgi:hypothetical protein
VLVQVTASAQPWARWFIVEIKCLSSQPEIEVLKMKWKFIATVTLVLITTNSGYMLAETASHINAISFVEREKIGRNLPIVALSIARRTVTFALIASRLGEVDAEKAVSAEIKALLPLYLPRWNENIAKIYEELFTEEELSSLALDGKHSKYASRVMSQQSAVGEKMESTAKPLLTDLVSKALSTTLSKNPGTKPIDEAS